MAKKDEEIPDDELVKAAYCMEKFYKPTKNRGAAIDVVSAQFPDISRTILAAMWHGIDAYVDLNEN